MIDLLTYLSSSFQPIPEDKTIEACPKHNIHFNGFHSSNGDCIGFNRNYNGNHFYCFSAGISATLDSSSMDNFTKNTFSLYKHVIEFMTSTHSRDTKV